jgi:DNA ligase-1
MNEILLPISDFQPMLAKQYNPEKFWDEFDECYSQPKLNGVRAVFKHGRFYTRTGKLILSCEHIAEKLFGFSQSIILDGEIYNHRFRNNLAHISGAARAHTPKFELEFHIYDAFFINDPALSFSERMEELKKLLTTSEYIKIVETTAVFSKESLDVKYESYLGNGYEGQMIRIDENYENYRSSFLLKRKLLFDDEFLIINIIEGKGKCSGKAGAVLFEDKNAKPSRASLKMDYATRQRIFEHKECLIGRFATIQHKGVTMNGTLIEPVCVNIGRNDA